MKPIVLLSNPRNQCVTICWPGEPRWYVGYRLIEYQPQTLPAPLAGIEAQPARAGEDWPETSTLPAADAPEPPWLASYSETNPQDAVQLAFQSYADGSAWCRGLDNQGAQTRELFFKPAEDGVWMWMRLSTREAIPGAFAVQQCLRFTGAQNEAWRQTVAHVPFLSELDLQGMGQANTTLTWVRREQAWFNLPVEHSVYATPPGRTLLGAAANGAVQHGLIVRETVERATAPDWYWQRVAPGATWGRIAAGLYWERTAYVSNRHPADCVHAVVDFGPLAAGHSRTVRGKFYYIEGTRDELLERWKKDFPLDSKNK
jgi:hypothetical protein